MSDFQNLRKRMDEGVQGRNGGIKMGFNRLNKYVGIRKKIYTHIFGSTGSGKTSYVHDAYILNPFDWIKSKQNKNNLKLKVILFSMERSKEYIETKWLSRKIFLDTGVVIPLQKMLGWWDEKLTDDELRTIDQYEDYLDSLTEVVDIIEGAQNPTGIYKYVKGYAETHGVFTKVSEYETIYTPNDPDEIVIPIYDTLGLTKLEKGMSSKKEAIDKVSEYSQYFRDKLGYSPIGISQITRNLGNVLYQKMDNFEPSLDDSKESGRPNEDADVVKSLFDPIRYHTNDYAYNAESFRNPVTGAKGFRSIKILKNTYGEDDIRIGMAFHGPTGVFKELPKAKDIQDSDYQAVIDGSYFLNV